MNQQKLQGEVNYLPLNVLKTNNEQIIYPDTSDAIALINKISFENKVEKAIKHIFERILLCRNSEIASQLAKQTKMDCVLLDGDFVSRKGALTGGYADTRQSKLLYYKQKLEITEQIASKESEINQLQKEILKIDSNLNTLLNDLQKHEAKSKKTKDVYDQMKFDLQSRKCEIERFDKSKPQKESMPKNKIYLFLFIYIIISKIFLFQYIKSTFKR